MRLIEESRRGELMEPCRKERNRSVEDLECLGENGFRLQCKWRTEFFVNTLGQRWLQIKAVTFSELFRCQHLYIQFKERLLQKL